MVTVMPKIVAYSKNEPFKGGKGYILYEFEVNGDVRRVKAPMTEFMRMSLK